jgi:WD40 repeat protein
MRLLLATAFIVLHAPIVLLRAAEPPTTPLLRIETGMHTAPIWRVATDAAGRLALTCSEDKTARLWSLPDLKSEISNPKSELLRTLRMPIGSGDEGKIFACALSPDGTVAALAGWTGYEWDNTNSIYLFDTASGQLLRCLGGLPNAILDLAFSPSGQTLATMLGAGEGLRLFDSRSGQLLAQDTEYGAAGHGVDWQGESRLVTTCFDGKLRLYKDLDFSGSISAQPRRLKPDNSRSLPQGNQPFDARFSPDGRQIAVGFYDSTQIALVSATDISSLPSPSTTGIARGNLTRVAWSADGRRFAAGGEWMDKSGVPIRLWQHTEDKSFGQSQDLLLAQNVIVDLQELPSGGFFWGACDPAWGITTAGSDDSKAVSHRLGSPPIADYRNQRDLLRLSADACVLAFGFQVFGKQPASFHLLERRLTLAPSAITTLRPPRTEGLPLTDWEDTTAPKLARQPLEMGAHEMSRSLATAPDSNFFLLGTEYWLRCYAKDGGERWKVPVPGVVWAVNLSADGRLAVAAYGDGTIRWHRASDGRELLAFFPHADQKRWVLWTTEHDVEKVASLGAVMENRDGKVICVQILPDTAAATSGMRDGDQLAAIGEFKPTNFTEAVAQIRKHSPGDLLTLRIVRDGTAMEKTVTLGEREVDLGIKAAYYDCSAGGEELIGWHVNRGKDRAADFYPADKFRDQFYRPDIIDELIRTWDIDAAVKVANAARGKPNAPVANLQEVIATMAPPVVELTVGGPTRTLELPEDSAETTLTYRVRGGSTPVSEMRVLVDSRPVEVKAPVPGDDQAEVKVTVPLPDRDCVVALLAGNRHAFSEPAIVNIRRKMTTRPSATAVPQKGTLYILAVGVSLLKNQAALSDLAKLEYADDDATAFHAALADQKKLYRAIESRVLTDDKATAGDILDAFSWLENTTKPEDTTLILLAGHGESNAQGRYTFCAHDYDRARRFTTGVGFEAIKLALGATKGEVVLFLDACSAGSSLGEGSRVNVTGLVNQLSDSDSNIVVFASSDGRTASLESDDLKQGLFTYCVKQGIGGKADLLKNGRISLSALQTYVDDEVRKLSDGQQIPVINIPKMVPYLTLGLVP